MHPQDDKGRVCLQEDAIKVVPTNAQKWPAIFCKPGQWKTPRMKACKHSKCTRLQQGVIKNVSNKNIFLSDAHSSPVSKLCQDMTVLQLSQLKTTL